MDNPFERIEEKLNVIAADLRRLIQRKTEPAPVEVGGMDLARAITGLSARTIYRKTCTRQIPHSKLNGRLYFKRADLEAWIEAGRRNTGS